LYLLSEFCQEPKIDTIGSLFFKGQVTRILRYQTIKERVMTLYIWNRLILATAVLLSAVSGCASLEAKHHLKVSDVVLGSGSLQESRFGMTITVDPWVKPDRVKQSFGVDLIAAGLLPVFVIAENHNSDRAFLLEKSNVSILLTDSGEPKNSGKGVEGPELSRPAIEQTKEGINTYSAGLVLTPLILPVGVWLLTYGDAKVNSAIVTSESISQCQFLDRTLYPGESYRGFLFFRIDSGRTIPQVFEIVVKAMDIQNGTPLRYVYSFRKEN
jgi:hypothetical protein